MRGVRALVTEDYSKHFVCSVNFMEYRSGRNIRQWDCCFQTNGFIFGVATLFFFCFFLGGGVGVLGSSKLIELIILWPKIIYTS